MKITVYTTNDCQFSKDEKAYLLANNLQYEEKNLESNKEFLTEMLAVSNNFAGTPVTKIEKDDGQIVVLKGFTKEEFDTTLNITAAPTAAPVVEAPVTPAAVVTPQAVEPPVMAMPQTPVDPKLNSILNDLQAKSAPAAEPPAVEAPPAAAPAAVSPPAVEPPVVAPPAPPETTAPAADSVAANLPTIPDPNFNG